MVNLPRYRHLRGREWYSRREQDRRYYYQVLSQSLFSFFASNKEILVNNCGNSTNEWVAARFTPSDDTLLCLGGNEGSVGLYKVLCALDENSTDLNSGMISCLKAHSGAVMGVYGVPGQSNELLSIGGDGTAKIFNMETKSRVACFDGHDTIVRSASFKPGSSNEFVTCGRDGKICVYDRRCKAKIDRNGMHFIPAVQSLTEAHYYQDGKQFKDFSSTPGLTNIIYVDENSILTSSDKAISGIRFWDPRKFCKNPYRQLNIPHRKESKQIGVASMDVNRYSSSLFVAVTDSNIYEFALGCGRESPVRRLTQSCTNSYDVIIATSPISDNLLSGSAKTDGAFMYNVPSHCCLDGSISDRYLEELKPAYKLEGHTSDVTAVSWSCQGTYMVTLDESRFRIWSPNFEHNQQEEFVTEKDNLPAFRRITFIGDQNEKGCSVSKFNKLTVSPMKSPFTSPVKKRIKMSSQGSPLTDATNQESPGRKKFRLYCKKYLTKNLPQRTNNDDDETHTYESHNQESSNEKKKAQRSLVEFFGKRNVVGPSTPQHFSVECSTDVPLFSSSLTTPSTNTIKRYFSPAPHNRRLK